MLDIIRNNAKSLGVKIAFGIIILVFVFWGIGNMQDAGSTSVIATVNGQNILFQDYYQAYRTAADTIRQRNPKISREDLKQMHLGDQVLRDLIMETLLKQEADRTGLAVSAPMLQRYITALPVFHNESGAFDPETYKRILAAQRTTPAKFEENIRTMLLQQKLMNDVTRSAWVTPEEARAIFNFTAEQREVEYLLFKAADYAAVPISKEEIAAFYDKNKALFAVPAKVDVEYILLHPADVSHPEAISDADINDWYTRHPANYTTPPKIKARHILLRVDPQAKPSQVEAIRAKAEALLQELRNGGDFAALATSNSEDPGSAAKGGDLGWIQPGTTVPSFEEAAFSLKSGQISDIVRSDFGFHIIKVEERTEAALQELAAVKDEIRTTLATAQANDTLRDELDNLIEANILGKPLQEIAAAHKLTAQRTGPVSAAELIQKFGLRKEDAATLLSTPAATSLDSALEVTGNGFMIARVQTVQPAATRPLDEVTEEIRHTLQQKKSLAAAADAAAAARKNLTDTADAKLPGPLQTSSPLHRTTPIAVLGPVPGMLEAIFAADPHQWLPTVFLADAAETPGAVLVRVKNILRPSDADWKQAAELVRSSLEEARKNELYQTFMQILASKAKVEIVNAKLMEQVDM